MTNAFIDARRRQSATRIVPSELSLLETAAASDPTALSIRTAAPEVHILYRAFKSDALKAMAGLPPDIRAVVALAMLEEFSYNEIAEMMECRSAPSVRGSIAGAKD